MQMVSTVRSTPNHYYALGLEPTASDEEIAQAFAKRMLAPRPMAEAARIGIAYAVLRDPAKRKDYDRSLGLNGPPPKLAPEALQWSYSVQARWVPFILSAPDRSDDAAAEPHVTASGEAEAPAEPEASAAASLHEPAEPDASEVPPSPFMEPEELLPPEATAEAYIPDPLTPRSARYADERGINWKPLAFIMGGLILGVAFLGAWAGMSAGHDVKAAATEPAAVALPEAKPHGAVAVSSAPVTAPAEPQIKWQVLGAAAAGSASRGRRNAPPPRSRPVTEPASAAPQAVDSKSDAAAGDPLAPETPAAQPVAASLPFPNHVVARTLQRIGYACGEVASTVEAGSPGVYKVTCTSGQAYQATSVRGRYRFRRVH